MGIDKRAAWLLDKKFIKVDSLFEGTEQMRKYRGLFLPASKKESSEDYEARVNRTFLYPAFKQAVKILTGKVFYNPMEIEGISPLLSEYLEDITLRGDSVDAFFKSVIERAFIDGITFILADHTTRPEGENLSLKDTEELNLRPYATHIPISKLIDIVIDYSHGKPIVAQVRFKEFVSETNNNFETKDIEQIRVLYYGGAWEIYRRDETAQSTGVLSGWTLYQSGVSVNSKKEPMTEIPLVPIYTNKTGFYQGSPYLEELADLNINHFQVSSNLGNILYYTSVPILSITGVPKKEMANLTVAANVALTLTDPSASVQWVELSGGGVKANEDRLKELKDQMNLLTLKPLMDHVAASKTATQARLESDNEIAELQSISIGLSQSLTKFIRIFQKWMGDEEKAEVLLQGNFIIDDTDYEKLRILNEAHKGKAVSTETLLGEYQKAGVISDDVNIDDELERIALEGSEVMRDE